jgi:hypothetical protein
MAENPRFECRKIRKPKIEKLRRARINNSLETLKQMLLQNTIAIPQGGRPTKLEKADILEMTVRYMQLLHKKLGFQSYENLDFPDSQIPLKTLWSNNSTGIQTKYNDPCYNYNKIMGKIEGFPIYKQEPQSFDSENSYENIIFNKKISKLPNLNKENENPLDSDEEIQITDESDGKPCLEQHWRPW